MEMKKSKKAQLRDKYGLFFNLGMVLALAFVISAFEWKSYEDFVIDPFNPTSLEEEWYEIPITIIVPPPPKPKMEIIEVPEDKLIEEMDHNFDSEMKPEDVIPVDIPVTIKVEEVDVPFVWVESMPEYLGGQEAFLKFVGKNIKYPRQAKNMGIEGKVFVEFVVDELGNLTNIKVIKGIGAGCDDEALRVIQSSPQWKPGKQRGKPVKVKMVIPITFQLRN